MRFRPGIAILALTVVFLNACSGPASPAASTGTATEAVSVQTPAASTPTPTASPTPSPTPIRTPTPTPAPTPTPDPWADRFHQGGAYLCVPDAAKGPWIYKDATLSIEVKQLRGGPLNRQYYMAEIYTRKPVFFGGFAQQNDTGYHVELPYKIARRYDAVFGITADYFNNKGNPKGVMIRKGKVYYDKAKAPTLAVMPDGELKVYEPGEVTAQQLLDMGVVDSFAFGPILVKDGKVDKESIDKNRLSENALEYRAAVGQIEKGHYIVIVTRGSFKLAQFAQLFVDNGCTLAYNMDGGHSACMIFMGEQLNQQYPSEVLKGGVRQRVLPDLMMIGVNPAVPDVKDKVYCDGVKVISGNKPKPTDGVILPVD